MNFKKLRLEDKKFYLPLYDKLISKTADYTIGSLFFWNEYFQYEYCSENDAIYHRLIDEKRYYMLPFAKDTSKAIKRLHDNFKNELVFCSIPEEYLKFFEETGLKYKVYEQSDYFDYFYLADDLIYLKGKKYNSKRNLIKQFIRSCDNYSFVEYDLNYYKQVRDFFERNFSENTKSDQLLEYEYKKIMEVLKNPCEFNMFGGVLIKDGEVCGFSFGEKVKDTLYIHIEKANKEVKGAYQVLVNEFAKKFCDDEVSYINREDDMGLLGLRKSKSSYQPHKMLKKYIVSFES